MYESKQKWGLKKIEKKKKNSAPHFGGIELFVRGGFLIPRERRNQECNALHNF